MPYSTQGSFYSYPTLSGDFPPCLVVKRREGEKKSAKVRHTFARNLPYIIIEKSHTAVLGRYLKSQIKICPPPPDLPQLRLILENEEGVEDGQAGW